MAIVGWIVVGLLVGVIAHARDAGPAPGSVANALVVGAFGGLLGGALAAGLGLGAAAPLSVGTWHLAALGAHGLLAADRSLRDGQRTRRLRPLRLPGLR